MPDLTRAQRRWLQTLYREGFVSMGGWAHGQKNRPLRRLVQLGYARQCLGPTGSCLKTEGFEITGLGELHADA